MRKHAIIEVKNFDFIRSKSAELPKTLTWIESLKLLDDITGHPGYNGRYYNVVGRPCNDFRPEIYKFAIDWFIAESFNNEVRKMELAKLREKLNFSEKENKEFDRLISSWR